MLSVEATGAVLGLQTAWCSLLFCNFFPPFACEKREKLTLLRVPVAKPGEKRTRRLAAVHR